MKKYLLLIILILFSSSSFSQDDSDAMTKLKNVKEVFEMGLVSQKEYDSIAKNLTQIILNTKVDSDVESNPESSSEEGFFRAGENENATEANRLAREQGIQRLKEILKGL